VRSAFRNVPSWTTWRSGPRFRKKLEWGCAALAKRATPWRSAILTPRRYRLAPKFCRKRRPQGVSAWCWPSEMSTNSACFPYGCGRIRIRCWNKAHMNEKARIPLVRKAEDAAFGAHRAAREPFGGRARMHSTGGPSRRGSVRHGVKERLAEIQNCCHPTTSPETAVRRRAKRENQSDGHNADALHQPSPIPKWTAPNEHESTIGCRPEKADASASVYCVYPRT